MDSEPRHGIVAEIGAERLAVAGGVFIAEAALLGLSLYRWEGPGWTWPWLVGLTLAALICLCYCAGRRLPTAALATAFGVCVLFGLLGVGILTVHVLLLPMTFRAARLGRWRGVLVGLAIVLALWAYGWNSEFEEWFQSAPGTPFLAERVYSDALTSIGFSERWTLRNYAPAFVLVAWVAGLIARLRGSEERESAAREEAEAAQADAVTAQTLASLRADQARFARDVHDAVGHSLAVVLAQAEAGRYAADLDRAQDALARIATTSRTALRDVRAALQSGSAAPTGDLLELVEGVRRVREVDLDQVGSLRPLPPELSVTAYRVLQELLTNALRHGTDAPLSVTLDWTHGLRIAVTNGVDPGAVTDRAGSGLTGVHERVTAVGGRLDLVRAPGSVTVTAHLPSAARAARAPEPVG